MVRHSLVLASLAALLSGAAAAQSIGSMTSPSSGAAAAGGSPVGALLPSSVQWGSTAPIQPGHTITGDRGTWRPGQGFFQPYASDDAAPAREVRQAREATQRDDVADAPRTARAAQ
ncbi:MAG: hypothetical protein U1F48_16515 [Burkholderiales bacterium]